MACNRSDFVVAGGDGACLSTHSRTLMPPLNNGTARRNTSLTSRSNRITLGSVPKGGPCGGTRRASALEGQALHLATGRHQTTRCNQ
jgi:hypothetical protein